MCADNSFASPEEFWEQSNTYQDKYKYQDKKFYVAFCMLESALSDYAIARDLHLHNKLNWACITYYYSLIHALRLICFMAKGDFPKRHDKLAYLFKGKNVNGGWLEIFLRQSENNSTKVNTVKLNLQDIISSPVLENTCNVEQKLRRWGDILDKARNLRNYTNYEGLIIAHEHAHMKVTENLRDLAKLLKKAAEEILPEVIEFFKNFIDSSHDRKDYWYAFLNYQEKSEGLYYLKDTLKYKLLGKTRIFSSSQEYYESSTIVFDKPKGKPIIEIIWGWLNSLRINIDDNKSAEEVWKNIQSRIFSTKRSLMKSFGDKIENLRQIIEGNQL